MEHIHKELRMLNYKLDAVIKEQETKGLIECEVILATGTKLKQDNYAYPVALNATAQSGIRAKWSDRLDSKVKEILTQEMLDSLQRATETIDKQNDPIKMYENLIQDLKSRIFVNNNIGPKKSKPLSKPWFDYACKSAKHTLDDAFRKARMANENDKEFHPVGSQKRIQGTNYT
uniref:Uncharacterized protein n=1 Tax=Sphaerodactylus townsendi TaxID=933632 RepID=A0ACB8EQ94_9SAUR